MIHLTKAVLFLVLALLSCKAPDMSPVVTGAEQLRLIAKAQGGIARRLVEDPRNGMDPAVREQYLAALDGNDEKARKLVRAITEAAGDVGAVDWKTAYQEIFSAFEEIYSVTESKTDER